MKYKDLTPTLNRLERKVKIASDIIKEREEKEKIKGWCKSFDEYQVMLLLDYLEYKKRVGELK